MNIRDFFDVRLLEEVMQQWSEATGMATIAMDSNNEYITGQVGFTAFCTQYTRGTKEGLRRCIECDANNTGVYKCHAGLMDFSFDIRLDDGTVLGKIIGGQILPEKPDLDAIKQLAKELGICQEEYLEAISLIEIRSEEAIRASAYLLDRVVNLLVNSEYIKMKQQQMITMLDEMSKTDSLTHVYNRAAFDTCIDEELQKNNRFALYIIDIDNFKEINDTFGHAHGDYVLNNVARTIKELFRESDIVGRFGGDEFYVIMRNVSHRDIVLDKAKKICANIASLNLDGENLGVTSSVGVVMYPTEANDANDILKKADRALYDVKENGKNGYKLYSDM